MRMQQGWAVAALIFVIAGCATNNSFYRSDRLARPATDTRIVVLAPDIELSELSAGGVLVPKAEWTEQARELAEAALKEKLEEIGAGASVVDFELEE
ncbi:MAG TPA: hypothetical protein VK973_18215, partial [Arenicellales bacterium]|nr:hypothetical protein [Arenicellales bacterium]